MQSSEITKQRLFSQIKSCQFNLTHLLTPRSFFDLTLNLYEESASNLATVLCCSSLNLQRCK